MTPRQARRERRAAEREIKKAEIRRTKADLLADPDPLLHHHKAEEQIGFVSQNELPSLELQDVPILEGVTLREWMASARKRNFPNGLPAEAPAREIDFVSQNFRSNHPADSEPAGIDHAAINRALVNRANAQLSTGPRTPEGRLTSSRNSTKHGLASGVPLIPGEDPAEFEALLADLLHDHQPANRTEELLVKQLAQSYWLEQRAIRYQNACFTEEGVDQKCLPLFLRYGTTHNRAFHKALADLHRLQKERRKAEQTVSSGFVSQRPAKIAVTTGSTSEFVRQNESSADLEAGFVSQTASTEPVTRRHTDAKAA